jgi:hypothetical protein
MARVSWLAVAKSRPSGWKAASVTAFHGCRRGAHTGCPVAASRRLAKPAPPPVTTRAASGL